MAICECCESPYRPAPFEDRHGRIWCKPCHDDCDVDWPCEHLADLPVPQDGEIWEDAEGTLMVRQGDAGWWCFGADHVVSADSPVIALPLRKAFDVAGNCVLDGPLRYPNRTNVDPEGVAAARARGGL